jgi:hypothetical protein
MDDTLGLDSSEVAVFHVGDAKEEGRVKGVVCREAALEGRFQDGVAEDPAGGRAADKGRNINAGNDL